MNKHNAKDYLPLVQALAEGKQLQSRTSDSDWEDVNIVGLSRPPELYRIKPTPTLRPWEPEEVPMNAIYRSSIGNIYNPLSMSKDGLEFSANTASLLSRGSSFYTPEELYNHHSYSIDGGKTWHPCGVVE